MGRDYNTRVMRFFGSQSFARSALLAAVAVLLCVGVFLPWLGDGPGAPGYPLGTHYSQADQGTNGHPSTQSYLAATGEEATDGDKGPVNAALLTALLLLCFFGMIVGWLCANDPGPGAFRPSGMTRRRPSFVIAREDAPFSGVFRL